MSSYYRVLDANLNRISEGIRVVEDLVRFVFDDGILQKELRSVRHGVRSLLSGRDCQLIDARNSSGDKGRETSRSDKIDSKADIEEIFLANFRRAEESFRVVEEILKAGDDYLSGKKAEEYRFELYIIEKKIWSLYLSGSKGKKMRKKLPKGIYGITAENFSGNRTNYQCVKEMLESGIKIIQYREKYKKKKEKFAEALELKKLVSEYGGIFIVNDDVDIAVACKADGIHIGQDDMPAEEVRKIVGDDMIIGLSTHSPEQAAEAVTFDIDYIGVGPLYATQTKDDVCAPVGLDYLKHVIETHNIEYTAIGGIKLHNLDQVLENGADRVCLVTEIVGAENIKETVDSINKKINEYRG